MPEEKENVGKMSREESGKKGGEAVSQDKEHMAEIGKKGGEALHEKRGAHGSDKKEESEEKKTA